MAAPTLNRPASQAPANPGGQSTAPAKTPAPVIPFTRAARKKTLLLGQYGPITMTAAQAKLFATETAQWVVDQAVQLHGARGLQRGHLLERLYREVRAPRIYEGASEVQRTIIARGLMKGSE